MPFCLSCVSHRQACTALLDQRPILLMVSMSTPASVAPSMRRLRLPIFVGSIPTALAASERSSWILDLLSMRPMARRKSGCSFSCCQRSGCTRCSRASAAAQSIGRLVEYMLRSPPWLYWSVFEPRTWAITSSAPSNRSWATPFLLAWTSASRNARPTCQGAPPTATYSPAVKGKKNATVSAAHFAASSPTSSCRRLQSHRSMSRVTGNLRAVPPWRRLTPASASQILALCTSGPSRPAAKWWKRTPRSLAFTVPSAW
mmetsp:Transcript_68252/g.182717  ORF Transcript_68252/g.182717 Transcript_68252/m.182717 type:complete len:258 (+) Transcript_68252:834-1607(+)